MKSSVEDQFPLISCKAGSILVMHWSADGSGTTQATHQWCAIARLLGGHGLAAGMFWQLYWVTTVRRFLVLITEPVVLVHTQLVPKRFFPAIVRICRWNWTQGNKGTQSKDSRSSMLNTRGSLETDNSFFFFFFLHQTLLCKSQGSKCPRKCARKSHCVLKSGCPKPSPSKSIGLGKSSLGIHYLQEDIPRAIKRPDSYRVGRLLLRQILQWGWRKVNIFGDVKKVDKNTQRLIVLVWTSGHKNRNPIQINLSKKGNLFTHITGMSKVQATGTVESMPITKTQCLSILSLSPFFSLSPTPWWHLRVPSLLRA